MKTYEQFYINGEWVNPAEGTNMFEVLNPANEEVIGQIAMGSATDVDNAVNAASKALSDVRKISAKFDQATAFYQSKKHRQHPELPWSVPRNSGWVPATYVQKPKEVKNSEIFARVAAKMEALDYYENCHQTASEIAITQNDKLIHAFEHGGDLEELVKSDIPFREKALEPHRKSNITKEVEKRVQCLLHFAKEDVEENLRSKVKGNVEDVVFVKNEKKPEESPAAFDIPDMLTGSIGGEDDGADNSPAE